MPQSNNRSARKLTKANLDFLNSILNHIECPLAFIQELKATAISAQKYHQAAILRDIEKDLLKKIE